MKTQTKCSSKYAYLHYASPVEQTTNNGSAKSLEVFSFTIFIVSFVLSFVLSPARSLTHTKSSKAYPTAMPWQKSSHRLAYSTISSTCRLIANETHFFVCFFFRLHSRDRHINMRSAHSYRRIFTLCILKQNDNKITN